MMTPALERIERAALTPTAYRLARRLLDRASFTAGETTVTRETLQELAAVNTWRSARKVLAKVAEAGIAWESPAADTVRVTFEEDTRRRHFALQEPATAPVQNGPTPPEEAQNEPESPVQNGPETPSPVQNGPTQQPEPGQNGPEAGPKRTEPGQNGPAEDAQPGQNGPETAPKEPEPGQNGPDAAVFRDSSRAPAPGLVSLYTTTTHEQSIKTNYLPAVNEASDARTREEELNDADPFEDEPPAWLLDGHAEPPIEAPAAEMAPARSLDQLMAVGLVARGTEAPPEEPASYGWMDAGPEDSHSQMVARRLLMDPEIGLDARKAKQIAEAHSLDTVRRACQKYIDGKEAGDFHSAGIILEWLISKPGFYPLPHLSTEWTDSELHGRHLTHPEKQRLEEIAAEERRWAEEAAQADDNPFSDDAPQQAPEPQKTPPTPITDGTPLARLVERINEAREHSRQPEEDMDPYVRLALLFDHLQDHAQTADGLVLYFEAPHYAMDAQRMRRQMYQIMRSAGDDVPIHCHVHPDAVHEMKGR